MSNKVTVDLSGYKEMSSARLAPGEYTVQVEDAEQTTANSGNQMINLWLRVMGGEFDGSVLVDRLVLTPNSLFRVVGFMQAIGMKTPKKRLSIDLRTFVGKVLDVTVEDGDPYRGVVRSEVRQYARSTAAPQAATADLGDLEEAEAPEPAPAPAKPAAAATAAPAATPAAADAPATASPAVANQTGEDDEDIDLEALSL